MAPGKMVYILALATALALTLVYQSSIRLRVGYDLAELQSQIAEERADEQVHQAQLSKLKGPRRIGHLVAWLGLDLQEPTVVLASAEEADPGLEGVAADLAAADTGAGVPIAAASGF